MSGSLPSTRGCSTGSCSRWRTGPSTMKRTGGTQSTVARLRRWSSSSNPCRARSLVGYSFKHDLERLLTALAGVPGVGVIRTGASLDAWRRGEIQVGLLHPKSAGHGLNSLKDAKAVVWYGLPACLESYQQLNGRVTGGHRRAGREIAIHHVLTEGTIDLDANELLERKDARQVAAQMRIIERLRGRPT